MTPWAKLWRKYAETLRRHSVRQSTALKLMKERDALKRENSHLRSALTACARYFDAELGLNGADKALSRKTAVYLTSQALKAPSKESVEK